jgi:hypothetical protein
MKVANIVGNWGASGRCGLSIGNGRYRVSLT